jgi:CDP-4-dehydro-6-deoxyglucose reductase, E1
MIGDVLQCRCPRPGEAEAEECPVLVIGPADGPADGHGRFEALQIGAARPGDPAAIPLPAGDFAEGGLDEPAAVAISDNLKLAPSDIVRPLGRLTREATAHILKRQILEKTRVFSSLAHVANRPGGDPLRPEFTAGADPVIYSGRVFTEDEVEAGVGSMLDFWLTLGPEGAAFERELAACLGVKHSLLVNSGSSANLIALAALTSPKLPGHRRILPGDEIITAAAGFPTTVAPILQVGAVPVFIDSDPATGNIRVDQLELAYAPGRTKAVMLAHTLGNPFDLGVVLAFCRRHGLWLIEDNCDALGSLYAMPVAQARALGLGHLLALAGAGTHPFVRYVGPPASGGAAPRLLQAPTGAWGDLSTQSFYPPHHLTTGEGGAVNIVAHPPLKACAESFRDWGRDCWCASGKDDTCGRRFGWQLGELPRGYDHKYVYSHLGYNLKPLDPQAAIGRRQLRKLSAFTAARRENWEMLRAALADLNDVIDFPLPTHAAAWIQPAQRRGSEFAWDATGCRSEPSWFGFMIRVRPEAPLTPVELARELDARKIGNRMLFGGNLLRQPVFVQLRRERPQSFRVVGDGLPGADDLMNRAIFVGVYPGLSRSMLDYIVANLRSLFQKRPSTA